MKLSRYKILSFNKFLLIFAIMMAATGNLCAQKKSSRDISDIHTSLYYSSRAADLEDANAWEEAKREIDEGLRYYPEDPELLYLNGRYYYYAHRDLQNARYNLVKSLQQDDQQFGARRVLIDVEEDSRHYSSAVCYINELLEQQPYDRSLWRRKISLYNKMGNKIEANEALERLSRIYPNDTVIKRELNALNRKDWNTRLSTSTLSERAKTLENLLNEEPENIDYYMELSDTYIKLGDYQSSLNTVKRGLGVYPGNDWLVRRAANILSEQGLYTRALSFLNENRAGGQLLTNAMRDAANDARLRDAYEMNGRLYARTGDRDALTYLLNTSLTRGYYDDAIQYLNDAYRLEGRTNELLLKEYALQKRMGNETQTQRLLRELFSKNPDNSEIRDQYIDMQLALALIDEEQQDYNEAYNRLTDACKAMIVGSDQWVASMARRIGLLGIMGKDDEARKLYGEASVDDPDNRRRFTSVYEDIVAKKLKQYIEEERYESALRLAQQLLGTIYNSEVALRTCINMSQTLKIDDLFYKYAQLGYEYFPEEPYFLIKQALALQQQNRYPEALALLLPQKEGMEYPSQQLINPFAGVTEDYAAILLKNKMPQLAIENIDKALVYDHDNRSLLYMKGLAYEQMKEYRLAYDYQYRNYNPSNAEYEDWLHHMRYLRFRSFKNRFDISYTSAFYDNHDETLASIAHMYSLATMSYSHLWKNTTLTIGANYKGTDGYEGFDFYETGGSGFEGWVEVNQELRHQWSLMASASYSTKYFNKVGANLGFTKGLRQGWSVGAKASYRLTPKIFLYNKQQGWEGDYKKRNLIILGPRASKEWARVGLHGMVDFITIDLKHYYYNATLKSKFFVNEDGVSAVGATVGFGSFPELEFFDQTTMNGITNMNAMVGVDGTILLTKNLFVTIAGTWNTYYNPIINNDGTARESYRNIYTVNAGLHLAF